MQGPGWLGQGTIQGPAPGAARRAPPPLARPRCFSAHRRSTARPGFHLLHVQPQQPPSSQRQTLPSNASAVAAQHGATVSARAGVGVRRGPRAMAGGTVSQPPPSDPSSGGMCIVYVSDLPVCGPGRVSGHRWKLSVLFRSPHSGHALDGRSPRPPVLPCWRQSQLRVATCLALTAALHSLSLTPFYRRLSPGWCRVRGRDAINQND